MKKLILSTLIVAFLAGNPQPARAQAEIAAVGAAIAAIALTCGPLQPMCAQIAKNRFLKGIGLRVKVYFDTFMQEMALQMDQKYVAASSENFKKIMTQATQLQAQNNVVSSPTGGNCAVPSLVQNWLAGGPANTGVPTASAYTGAAPTPSVATSSSGTSAGASSGDAARSAA